MQQYTTALRPTVSSGGCEHHSGNHQVLIRAGKDEWIYYGLTGAQLRFWRGLNSSERSSLIRAQGRGCFICAVERAVGKKRKLAEPFYTSMMGSLLAEGGAP